MFVINDANDKIIFNIILSFSNRILQPWVVYDPKYRRPAQVLKYPYDFGGRIKNPVLFFESRHKIKELKSIRTV